MSEGTPLVPSQGSVRGHREAPNVVEERIYERSERDWDYWRKVAPTAVEFAKAAIRPEMTQEEKQAMLLASLKTIEQWVKSE